MAIVSLKHVVRQRVMGCARSSVIDEGLEDNIVRPHPEQELAVCEGRHAPPAPRQPDLPEHVLEASTIVAGKAGAPPRPRTNVGQAGTGSNPAEPSV